MARGFNYAPINDPLVDEAASPGLAKDRILALADSRNALVRSTIAAREDCPFGLMASMAHDFSSDVRAALARNPRLLHSVMEHLSRDKSVDVLVALTENPSVTSEILDALVGHRKRDVQQAAASAMDALRTRQASEDAHTPELRDRVFEQAAARRAEALAAASTEGALEGAIAAVAADPPEAEPEVRVRTAPVRGFKPPIEA
ncbi:hypothetical protein QQX10_09595 [Demequina sp. SYSU T00039]|uniref:Leucine rich repeat variant n=1 Tax=Demequina lignilytica TaxID=3051663 RepID=A0AAW7MA05_9MICO|nr:MULTISPECIES: hypothetical protein [unclassified Demequina]MDN4478128.1 hypothetical protein [Demequina sp. SYSU T00039-1]MDN4488422.1 hypothetical protein [Demequina sp. SYSU T00039]MDN4490031.1 hypothetical protein [Demequina sp. SYSU T00068]